MKKTLILLALVILSQVVRAQQGFGTSNPAPSSVIDMTATNKGVLMPRIALTSVTDITTIPSAANALTVFNTATAGVAPDNVTPGYYYWSVADTKWIRLLDKNTPLTAWNLTGNSATFPGGGTTGGTDFLGTTDAKDFQIKVGLTSPYNNIMRVNNVNGHTQFGNWWDTSTSPNVQNADKFQNGVAIQNYLSPFVVANNFQASDLTGNAINGYRNANYINATSAIPFFANFNFSQFNNGYTGPIYGTNAQVRLDGNATYSPSGQNQIIAVQGVVSLIGTSSITSAGGVVGVSGILSPGATTVVNGPAYGVKGRTTTSGTYNGPVAGVQGSIEATVSATYNGIVYGTQGIISQGTFNTNVIGAEGSIIGGTFGAGSNAIGLHSNVSGSAPNGYGLYIEDVAGTAQWGLYQIGTNDNNYFAGNVGIGISPPTNKLHVSATSDPVRFQGLQTGLAGTDNIVVADANGVLKTIAPTSFLTNNLYTANGTLAGPRVVTMGTNLLSFANGTSRFNLSNTTTDANVSILASNRANMRWAAGSGATGSYLDIFQDVSAIGQIAVSGASTGLQVGSANGSATPVYLITNGTNRISVLANGNVGIGTDNMLGSVNPAVKLAVNGSILTTNSIYADYVFEDYFEGTSKLNTNYKFKSLNEVEKFILDHRHLPGVTNIEALTKNEKGDYIFDVSKLSIQVLEKVEELYLHTIEQQKLLENKDKEILELKKTTQQMNERLLRLEQLLLEKK